MRLDVGSGPPIRIEPDHVLCPCSPQPKEIDMPNARTVCGLACVLGLGVAVNNAQASGPVETHSEHASWMPAHPKRVAEALHRSFDDMLVRVFDGPARVDHVDCWSDTFGGRQSRVVNCAITLKDVNLSEAGSEIWLVYGRLMKGACGEDVTAEDATGEETVVTHNRGTQCFVFGNGDR